MGKIIAGIVAAVVGFMTMANVASTGGGKFDYATASEERQQKFLEGVADGFSAGFKATAGKSAELTRAEAKASIDMVSFTIHYRDERIEKVGPDQIQKQKTYVRKQSCKLAERRKFLDSGVTLRIRMKKPSGASMGRIDINAEECARWG